jgi:threonine dehydratase
MVPRALLLDSASLLPAGAATRCLLAVDCLNRAGSFKLRGAVAALSVLGRGQRVVASSAGNHGSAVAIAARSLGLSATVVVSVHADPAKIARIRSAGANLVLHGDTYDDAERHAIELAGRMDAMFVSPYNDPLVIAGQASLGRELVARLGQDLTVVVPVGGGGLAAGVALVAGGAVTVGVVAERSPAMSEALRAGRIVAVELGDTLADALAGNLEPDSVTFELVRDHVESVVAVGEAEMATAMRFLYAEHGLVAEGGGAAAVAAVRAGLVAVRTATCVAVVTGRNVDPRRYASVLSADGGG